MSYKRKLGQKITKFFGDTEFAQVKKACKRYEGLMSGLGMNGLNVQWSSIQRFDIMCTVPTDNAKNIREDICGEIDRDLPGETTIGEANIREIGGGRSRVQIPVFPR